MSEHQRRSPSEEAGIENATALEARVAPVRLLPGTPVPEHFLDDSCAAEVTALKLRRALDLARAGSLPAHPLGTGLRREWRFRLSELENALCHVIANSSMRSERRTYRSRQSSDAETGT
jgi:hypothetical protein